MNAVLRPSQATTVSPSAFLVHLRLIHSSSSGTALLVAAEQVSVAVVRPQSFG